MTIHHISATRIERARDFMAHLSVRDPVYLPIFERLEVELEEARARESVDPIEAARALLRASKGRALA